MSGKSIIFVGGTGTGKTTLIKGRLKKVSKDCLYLFDINNEYTEFFDKPLPSFVKFSKQCTKLNDAIIVYEEATIFLSNKGSNSEVNEVLVRKRHTNNTIFFVFHSLRSVPRWLFDLSNYLFLLKTNDSLDTVEKKFDHDALTTAFKEVQLQSQKDKHFHKLVSIY